MNHRIAYGEIVARNLRNARFKAGLSLKEVRKATGLVFLGEYESGEMYPQISTIRKLEEFYKIESLIADPDMKCIHQSTDSVVIITARRLIGKNIKKLRLERKITKIQLARDKLFSIEMLTRLEYGSALTEQRLQQLADYMHVPVKELIGAPSITEFREMVASNYDYYNKLLLAEFRTVHKQN